MKLSMKIFLHYDTLLIKTKEINKADTKKNLYDTKEQKIYTEVRENFFFIKK